MSGNDPRVRSPTPPEDRQAVAQQLYADEAVLEFPQSGERFVGKRNFLEWRGQYPAEVEFAVLSIRGGALWIVEVSVSYDGKEWHYGVSIHEFRDRLVAHETIYWAPGWEAPEWRARWRAAEPSRDRSESNATVLCRSTVVHSDRS